jgi:putative transposase
MATFRRALTPGATYFFTANTYQRQRLLTQAIFVEAFKQGIAEVQQGMPFTIDAIVLLPDHLHCSGLCQKATQPTRCAGIASSVA